MSQPFLSKLLEKVVLHQLRNYLLANNFSDTFQSVYRAYESTDTAFLDLTNCLLGSADEGQVSILTLLDLSTVFDTLNHSSLLFLHDMFGIRGKAFEWFSSYLSDRFQSVSVNGRFSSKKKKKKKLHYGDLSSALLSLLCRPRHCLTSSLKVIAFITDLLMTLNFNQQLHLIIIH